MAAHAEEPAARCGSARSLTAFGVVAAGATMFAPAANAAYSCRDGQVCFFSDQNLHGTVFLATALRNEGNSVQNFGRERFTNGYSANDSTSSIDNQTGLALYVYTNSDWNGTYFKVKPHEKVFGVTRVQLNTYHNAQDFDNWMGSIDDQISSATLQSVRWLPPY
jgi:hypothetical protein